MTTPIYSFLFLQNKYSRCYYNIVANRSKHQFDGYTEKHHIIPKSLGGPDAKWNLVDLSAREHFLCHRLLLKMLSGEDRTKMIYPAFTMMHWKTKDQQRTYKINSKTYQKLKEEFSKIQSLHFKGIPKTELHKQKIRESNIGKHDNDGAKNPMFGKKHSEKVREESRKRLAKTNSLRRWYNDGCKNLFSIDHPGDGWNLGRLQKPTTKGFKWYNNGIEQRISASHPGDGWLAGKIKSE